MNSKSKIFFWLITVTLIFAIWGTYGLAMSEFTHGHICPKILSIPACYIVLVCFFGGLLTHIIAQVKYDKIYFAFIGIVTIMASTGTLGELFGFTECPRTDSGIPMCFISLFICISLIIFKVLQRNNRIKTSN